MLRFMIALVIGLVANVNGVTAASAQSYPQRAVKFILPFGPAAGSDITARLLRARGEWPCSRRAAEKGDELAPLHTSTIPRQGHAVWQIHGAPQA